jgi:hypothetical protein
MVIRSHLAYLQNRSLAYVCILDGNHRVAYTHEGSSNFYRLGIELMVTPKAVASAIAIL